MLKRTRSLRRSRVVHMWVVTRQIYSHRCAPHSTTTHRPHTTHRQPTIHNLNTQSTTHHQPPPSPHYPPSHPPINLSAPTDTPPPSTHPTACTPPPDHTHTHTTNIDHPPPTTTTNPSTLRAQPTPTTHDRFPSWLVVNGCENRAFHSLEYVDFSQRFATICHLYPPWSSRRAGPASSLCMPRPPPMPQRTPIVDALVCLSDLSPSLSVCTTGYMSHRLRNGQ